MKHVARDELAEYLDDLLEVEGQTDYGPNGLQVEGPVSIDKLVTGVSACLELFERAADAGAQAVLVHHGVFWRGDPQELTGWRYRRIASLIERRLNLFAYHLPLDRHATFGNNALAARAFGLQEAAPFGDFEGEPVGFAGRLAEPVSPEALVARSTEIFDREPLTFLEGPDPVRSLAIVSGGAQKLVHDALIAGYDAYLTGEVSEWVMNVAREAGIHYLAAGHYATERLGVRALGEHVAERFGIEVEFLDVPNPV